MSIEKAFWNAWDRMRAKNWEHLYILVDVHGVLMEPDYTKPSSYIYPQCVNVLRQLSEDPRYKLILWTCSRKRDIEKYRHMFEALEIKFDWVNENPEVQHVDALGDYTAKLYANLILDDKAGFDPEEDWRILERIYNNALEMENDEQQDQIPF